MRVKVNQVRQAPTAAFRVTARQRGASGRGAVGKIAHRATCGGRPFVPAPKNTRPDKTGRGTQCGGWKHLPRNTRQNTRGCRAPTLLPAEGEEVGEGAEVHDAIRDGGGGVTLFAEGHAGEDLGLVGDGQDDDFAFAGDAVQAAVHPDG